MLSFILFITIGALIEAPWWYWLTFAYGYLIKALLWAARKGKGEKIDN